MLSFNGSHIGKNKYSSPTFLIEIPFEENEMSEHSDFSIKRPIHSQLICAIQLCKKTYTKNRTECPLALHRFPIRFISFLCVCVSFLCAFSCMNK
jgi:hypothetical protein